MFRAVVVVDKATGAQLAKFVCPGFLPLEFNVEFGDNFARLFVIRNMRTKEVFDWCNIGNNDIKIETKNI